MDQTARALVLTAAAPWAGNAGASSQVAPMSRVLLQKSELEFAEFKLTWFCSVAISAMLRIWEKFAA